ncbi:MAG: CHRD domain-containing protein, partial [Gammaproteobacteria bacterium]
FLLLTVSGLPLVADDDDDDRRRLNARLTGFQEVPAVSTEGRGDFRATINEAGTSISFRLRFSGLSSATSAAHIHLGQRDVNGGVLAFLCGGGGKPACPMAGTVEGTIVAADVTGLTAQGIAAGEFAEVVRAIRAGVVYVNVHTTNFPNGEVRGQIGGGGRDHDDDDDEDGEDHDEDNG